MHSLDDRYARLAATRAVSGRAQQAALALLLQLARGGPGGGGAGAGGAAALNAIATYQPPRLVKAAPLLRPGRDAGPGRAPDQGGRGSAGQLQQAAAARAAGQAPGCTVRGEARKGRPLRGPRRGWCSRPRTRRA
jgi:hypothetical protein